MGAYYVRLFDQSQRMLDSGYRYLALLLLADLFNGFSWFFGFGIDQLFQSFGIEKARHDVVEGDALRCNFSSQGFAQAAVAERMLLESTRFAIGSLTDMEETLMILPNACHCMWGGASMVVWQTV